MNDVLYIIYIYIYIHFVNSCFTIFLDSIPCSCPQPNLLPAVAIHGFLGTFPGSAGRGELPGSCRWFGKRLWGGLQPDHAPVSLVCFSNAPWKFYLQGTQESWKPRALPISNTVGFILGSLPQTTHTSDTSDFEGCITSRRASYWQEGLLEWDLAGWGHCLRWYIYIYFLNIYFVWYIIYI